MSAETLRDARVTLESFAHLLTPTRTLNAEQQETLAALVDRLIAQARADPQPRIVAARWVAQHWLTAIMANDSLRSTGMSHPVAMVIAALDGETDPQELGIAEEAWPAFRAATGPSAGAVERCAFVYTSFGDGWRDGIPCPFTREQHPLLHEWFPTPPTRSATHGDGR